MPQLTDIEKTREKIRIYQQLMGDYANEQSSFRFNNFISFVTGVVAPTAKPLADAGINMIARENKALELGKGGYELVTKLIELKYSKTNKEAVTNFVDFLVTNEDDNVLKTFWHAAKSYDNFKHGKNIEGTNDGLDVVSDITDELLPEDHEQLNPFEPFNDGLKIGKGLKESEENYNEWSDNSDRMNEMFAKQQADLQENLDKENKKLFELSEGKEGSLSGMKNSGNVFNRIAALCAEIRVKIGQVQHNLQVQ